jgi:hypothetical protein
MGCWSVGAGPPRIARVAGAIRVFRAVESSVPVRIASSATRWSSTFRSLTAGPAQQVEHLHFADLAQRHEDADRHPILRFVASAVRRCPSSASARARSPVSCATSTPSRSEASAWPSDRKIVACTHGRRPSTCGLPPSPDGRPRLPSAVLLDTVTPGRRTVLGPVPDASQGTRRPHEADAGATSPATPRTALHPSGPAGAG